MSDTLLRDALAAVRVNLVFRTPALGDLVLHFALAEDASVASLGCDGERILYNPGHMRRLSRQQAAFSLSLAALAAPFHLFKDRRGRDPAAWDAAVAQVVGACLADAGVGSPPPGCPADAGLGRLPVEEVADILEERALAGRPPAGAPLAAVAPRDPAAARRSVAACVAAALANHPSSPFVRGLTPALRGVLDLAADAADGGMPAPWDLPPPDDVLRGGADPAPGLPAATQHAYATALAAALKGRSDEDAGIARAAGLAPEETPEHRAFHDEVDRALAFVLASMEPEICVMFVRLLVGTHDVRLDPDLVPSWGVFVARHRNLVLMC